MLITWNSQGKNPTSYILFPKQGFTGKYNVKPDYICIQEAGTWTAYIKGDAIPCTWNPSPSYKSYYQLSTVTINNADYIGYMVPWQASLDGNKRCTLVILWRENLGTHADFPITGWHDGNSKHRPVFWITKNSDSISCIHAPSGGGASTLLYIINAITQITGATLNGNWLIAGDFNFLASYMQADLPKGVAMIASKGATQKNGGNIDYLLRNSKNDMYQEAASAESYIESDHLQVRFV